jgi:histone acetyltransferase 1
VKLPSRLRISQFLLLPSYRASGHGTALYLSIYNHALSDPLITEVTVEDPNEEFDALRDYADYATLLNLFDNAGIALNPTPIPVTARKPKKVPTNLLLPTKRLHALRKQQKIAPRQFARVLEMHLLGSIPGENRASLARLTQKHRASNENDRKYYWWRLLVKQRIYKKQIDILMQLDPSERVEALDRAVSSQQDEYGERLEGFVGRLMRAEKEGLEMGEGSEEAKVNGNGIGIISASEVASARAKRKVVIEDGDDDSEGSKRVKL